MTLVEPAADHTPGKPPRHRRGGLSFVLGIVALVVAATGGWLWWSVSPEPSFAGGSPASSAGPDSAPAFLVQPTFLVEVATEQQIRDHTPTALSMFRFADNPRILVLAFASLRDQGRTLNRVAALVEKAGLPRDRALNDIELDRAIRAQGDTSETFFYGHDYGAGSLARFFALADRDGIELSPEEETLRALLRQEGWLTVGVHAALISLPAVGTDPKITPAARASILRHELSHGEFFSEPGYAGYVRDFWLTVLTADERAAFRRFLAREGYDTAQEALMFNEMQAYLMFTRDPLFFVPAQAGLTAGRLAELQMRFFDGMPRGWLRDLLAAYRVRLSPGR
jgi:hypothetical protein